MTTWRRARLGARALMITIPSCAITLAASQAIASPAQEPLRVNPRSVRVTYGHSVVVRGTAPVSDAGHTIVLQFARRGQSGWRPLDSSTIGADGQFRLAGVLTQSGAIRALDSSSGSVTTQTTTSSATYDTYLTQTCSGTKSGYVQVNVTDKYTPLFPIHFASFTSGDGTYHIAATAGTRTF